MTTAQHRGGGGRADLDRVGVLGLGTMGAAMAGRLLDQGHDLVVWNRTPARCTPLAERGARVAGTPAEAARDVDVVLVSVADREAVEDVLVGPQGAAETLRPGGVVVDTSTVPPEFRRSCAARLTDSGHRLLDACILGNSRHAADGELRFLVGGEPDVFDQLRPLLDALGKEVVLLGGHGAGASMKIVLNMLMGIEMQALAEAVALGRASGLDRADVLRAVAQSGFASPVMRFKAQVMQRQAYDDPQFRLALMRKDMTLATSEADRLGVPLVASQATASMLTAAAGQGLGDLDCAAVVALVERLSGLEPAS